MTLNEEFEVFISTRQYQVSPSGAWLQVCCCTFPQTAGCGRVLHLSSPICLMQEIGIDHLHIPTVDYLYAPPVEDLHRGVAFIAG